MVSAVKGYQGPQASYDVGYRTVRADLTKAGNANLTLSNAFLQISNAAQDQITREAVDWAQKKGRAEGGINTKEITVVRNGKAEKMAIPKLELSSGGGAVQRAYNEAAVTTFGMRLSTITQNELIRIEQENYGDPEGMVVAIGSLSAGIKQSLPPDILPAFEQEINRLAQPMITQAYGEKLKKTAKDQATAVENLMTATISTLSANAAREGAQGIAGMVVDGKLYKDFYDAVHLLAKRNPMFFSEADADAATIKFTQQAVKGMLAAQFGASPKKSQWFALFSKGELAVKMPHIDPATGEVTMGAYDAASALALLDPQDAISMTNMMQADVRSERAEQRAAQAEYRLQQKEITDEIIGKIILSGNMNAEQAEYLSEHDPNFLWQYKKFAGDGGFGRGQTAVIDAMNEITFGIGYSDIDLMSAGFNRQEIQDIKSFQKETTDIKGSNEFAAASDLIKNRVVEMLSSMNILGTPGESSTRTKVAANLEASLVEQAIRYQRRGYKFSIDPDRVTFDDASGKFFSPYAWVDQQLDTGLEKINRLTDQKDALKQKLATIPQFAEDPDEQAALDLQRANINRDMKRLQKQIDEVFDYKADEVQ